MKKWILSAVTVIATLAAICIFISLVAAGTAVPLPTVPTEASAPTAAPTAAPSTAPAATGAPTVPPTTVPPTTVPPTTVPPTTVAPTQAPTEVTEQPTEAPTEAPTEEPTEAPAEEYADAPYITATSAFVYDSTGSELVYCLGDMGDQIYPASITKLFTGYVALQHLSEDTVVTGGEELYYVDPDSSLAYIAYGNQLTVDMLIEGMMLPSGNDAAYMLAAAAGRVIAGDPYLYPEFAVDEFVEEMNLQAAIHGMSGTHFSAPDGIHWDDHFTTMEDLITVAELALTESAIRACGTDYASEVFFESGEYAYWVNTNKIVNPDSSYYHPSCIGLKTGHTSTAGYCLLSAFEIDGRTYIVGVFGCPGYDDRFSDTLTLIDHYT